MNLRSKFKNEIPSVITSKVFVRGAIVFIVPGQHPDLNIFSVKVY